MPQVNLSDEEYKRRVQAIRDFFAKRIYDLYVKCANGEITEYHKLVDELHSLDFEYADALEPYGLAEDLRPDDYKLIQKADDNDEPLKDFAYNWLSLRNEAEFRNVDITSFIPIAHREEEDDGDDDYNI